MSEIDPAVSQPADRRWQPLSAIERRVAGVLVEKAKTTPEAYPLSLNAMVTGCNQKSNRFPTMELQSDAVEDALERLRALGAVALVQGGARVDRYRHLLYEWLGVEKVEMAVMAELLLRGAQTEGELRGRAARMEPIVDVAALRPVLDSLRSKGLIISLTREGRGHVLTHALYQPRELERLQAEFGTASADQAPFENRSALTAETARATVPVTAHPAAAAPTMTPSPTIAAPATTAEPTNSSAVNELRNQLRELQETVAELQAEIEDCRREIQDLRQALGA